MALHSAHLLLDNNVPAWNKWRHDNPSINPDLSGLSLSRTHLAGADFNRCSLIHAHLNHADLSHCNLERANLSNASVQQANLTNANCDALTASGANFSGTNASSAIISNADLSSAHLSNVRFDDADLSGTNLNKANFFEASLKSALLTGANLHWCNLTGVDLSNANLQFSDLTGASFISANLTQADLSGANLRFARFIDSQLDGANLSGCRVYGVAVWNVSLVGANESNLIITEPGDVAITVDNLAIAQFIYLLLDSKDIRKALDTMASKVVLILGRFTPERKSILNAIREALRARDYLPLLFDFAGPTHRDITETVSTLAHLARFVIADITDAKSIPQELMAIVPNLPSVPIQPLVSSSNREYAMFEHFKRFPWVLKTFHYQDIKSLLNGFDENVIRPAAEMAAR